MISVKSKNKKMSVVIVLMMMLVLNTASCEGALSGKGARFERSFDSEFKSSFKFHGAFQGNNANNKNGDQVFGDDKRKVYTGPNPLHNR